MTISSRLTQNSRPAADKLRKKPLGYQQRPKNIHKVTALAEITKIHFGKKCAFR